MKKWITALTLMTSLNSFAGWGIIDNIYCGKIAPNITKEACILFYTDQELQNKKIAVVFNGSDFSDYIYAAHGTLQDLSQLNGREAIVDLSYVNYIYNSNKIQTLKRIDARYFYLKGNIMNIEDTFKVLRRQ